MKEKRRSRFVSVVLAMAVTFTMLFIECGVVNADNLGAGESIAIDETVFPDEEFRSYVSQFDTNNDGYLSDEERSRVTQIYIDSWDSNVKSLSGVEVFLNLRDLKCRGLDITELNVTNNTQLETLDCSDTRIKSLNLSANKNLKDLSCSFTGIESLDLSENPQLEELNCKGSYIENLDLSQNVNLKELDCGATYITELNLEANVALERLNCEGLKLSSLDLSKNVELKALYCDDSWISDLNVSNNKKLRSLSCNGTKVKSLNLKQNTELVSLECRDTLIEKLDLSGNVNLTGVNCSSTRIKELDLSKNEWLISLDCENTQISNLDVSRNKSLTSLSTTGSPIAYLDLSKNSRLGMGEDGGTTLHSTINVNTAETTLDLEKQFPGIDVSKIVEIHSESADDKLVLNGKMLSGYHNGSVVSYTYDCNATSTRASNLKVKLYFKMDGFNSGTSSGGGGGYLPPVSDTKPVISEGEGYSTFIGDNGKTVLILVDEGYELVDVTLNGVSKGKVTKIKNLKTSDRIVVTVNKQTAPVAPSDNERLINGVQNTKVWITKTSKGKGWIKLNYKKSKGFKVDYYEVFRKAGKNSKFGKKAFYQTRKNGLKGWYKNTNSLKKGTRYYYKVRGVRVIDGKKYYTKWSKSYYRIAK